MPSTYPALSTTLPTTYYELEPEYPGAKTVYQDGGADYVSLADTATRRWVIFYENVDTTERDSFKTLATAVKYNPREGSLIGMNFTPKGESLLSNVFFDADGLVCVSKTSSVHNVTVKLIKRP